jgi:hypothetical protein
VRQIKGRVIKYFGVVGLLVAMALAWTSPLGAAEPLGPDAEALWKHINQDPNFHQWGTWPEFNKLRRSFSPFGFFVRVFVNDVALQAKGRSLPPGSILVREGFGMDTNTYAPSDQIVGYTVMYKIKGFNPAASDWFWAHYSGTGKVMSSGALDQCIKCHDTGRDNDFVLDHKVR